MSMSELLSRQSGGAIGLLSQTMMLRANTN